VVWQLRVQHMHTAVASAYVCAIHSAVDAYEFGVHVGVLLI
jgi:hypothetical protein